MSFDDQPVGQHTKLEIPELPPEAPPQPSAPSSASLSERLANKNAKTRFEAMAELLKKFTEAEGANPIFAEHYPAFHKFIGDAHPGVQEKALECFLLLLNKSPPQVDGTLSGIVAAILEKSSTSAKTATRAQAAACLGGVAELENSQPVIRETLMEYLRAKSTAPKIVAAALQAQTQLLALFGNDVFPVKDVLSLVLTQAASTAPTIKLEAMNYLREAHRWVKDQVLPALETLKPAQQEELKKQFVEDAALPPPVAEKRVKGKVEKMSDTVPAPLPAKEEKKEVINCLEEVSVARRFGETWCAQLLALKKWSERRDRLEELVQAISVPKLKNEGITELGQTLKKLLNDSNIVVVNQALKIIGLLAKGLRSNFAGYSKHIYQQVIQKFKDKKTTLEAQKCLENLTMALHMEDMLEEIKESLTDKSPIIKTRVCEWLETVVLPGVTESLARSMSDAFSAILIKLTDDAVSEVRDAALSCLGVIKGLVKDAGLDKAIQEMNVQKQQKILKSAEQVAASRPATKAPEESKQKPASHEEVKRPDPEPMQIQDLPIVPPVAEEKKIEDTKTTIPMDLDSAGDNKPRPNKAELIIVGSEAEEAMKPIKPKPKLGEKPKKAGTKGKEEKKMKEVKVEDVGELVGLEEASKQVGELIPSEILLNLDQAEWKERQKKLQDINELLKKKDLAPTFSDSLAIFLKHALKDFKESNINVVKEGLGIIVTACSLQAVSKKFACAIVPGLVDKMSDAKLADTCTEALLLISDSATPTYVATVAVKAACGAKSLGVIKGVLALLSKMIEEFGGKMVPLGVILDYAKFCLAHANPGVRTMATKCICVVFARAGEVVRPLIAADMKEATLKSLEAELAKVQPVKDEGEPKRKLKGVCEAEAAGKKKLKDVADSLVPRTNISAQINSKLLASLGDGAMKKRQEAKDSIEKILSAANNRILPAGLNSLMGALKGRMNEPCKNLAKGFIALVGSLAAAMGSGCKQYHKVILQPMMYNLADKQPAIRAETLIAINKFAEACGHDVILNNLAPLLEKDNPDMRSELLRWILVNKAHLARADVSSLVGAIVTAMQDRSKEIRTLAEEVVGEAVPHVGHQAFMSAIKDLKPIVKASLETVLEKFKPKPVALVPAPVVPDSKMAIDSSPPPPPAVPIPEIIKAEPIPELVEIKQEPVSPPPRQRDDVLFTAPEPMKEVTSAEEEAASVSATARTMESARPDGVVKAEPLSEEEKKSTPVTPQKKQKGSTTVIIAQKRTTTGVPPKTPKAGDMSNRGHKQLASKAQNLGMTTGSIMSASRSVNDLLLPQNGKKLGKMQSRKDVTRAHVSLLKQSPSKSQLSSSSAVGTLFVETVVVNQIGNKEKRAEADKNAKWPVNEIREDYVEKLKKGLRPAIHPSVFDYMFAPQFKKNLEAVRLLTESVKSDFHSMVDIMDLVFKWLTIKMVDQSNTAINKSIVEFLTLFFAELYQTHYVLLDFEAAAIVPMLCERLGSSNPTLREEYKGLLKKVTDIYNVSKIANHLLKALESKNPKTKIECLGFLRELIATHTTKILAARDIKAVAKLMASPDSGLKSETVDFLCEVFRQKADKTWPLLGEMAEKNLELLKQKFAQVEPPGADGVSRSIEKISLSPSAHLPQESMTDIMSVPADKEPIVRSESERNFSKLKVDKLVLPDELGKEEDKTEEERKKGFASVGRTPTRKSLPESLEQCLEMLKNGDISKKVDALVYLNEKATTEHSKDVVIGQCDLLFRTFAEVLNDIFAKPAAKDIPIRFAKYFLSVFNKICAIRVAVKEVSEPTLTSVSEQLLSKLLFEGLGKLGENEEGEAVIKSLNAAMLRIMENAEPTRIFIVLFGLFRKFKDTPGKLPGLIVKCLLKLSKIIESLVASLNVSRLLLCMHEYLLQNPSSPLPKGTNDEIGVRIVKTLINELVKVRKESIWEDYKSVEQHPSPDQHIKRWITIILKSLHAEPEKLRGGPSEDRMEPMLNSPDELKEIFKGLNSQATFSEAIKSLNEFMQKNPQTDLNQYFGSCSRAFSQFVLHSLQDYKNSKAFPSGPSKDVAPLEKPGKGNEGSLASLSEYRAKMAFLKQKLGILQSGEKAMDGQRSEDAASVPADMRAKIEQYKTLIHGSPKKGS